ncbi:hypothetical protein TNCV_4990041 [Trichonephila clavipes]|uniref:Uncharacterized protein n=1 Tax=Trichonephila clavipes TaxID=2585209 RepID=A0A8X6WAS7_TRICX|nr:hypothetical protein TNCV_4990041 [Trichonephila clavipes]
MHKVHMCLTVLHKTKPSGNEARPSIMFRMVPFSYNTHLDTGLYYPLHFLQHGKQHAGSSIRPSAWITALIRLGIVSTCLCSAFTFREYNALDTQLFKSCKLDGGRVLSDMSFHPIPHVFYWVKSQAIRWTGKVLEIRLMFSEPILNTSGTMCSCIIVHKTSVTIRNVIDDLLRKVDDMIKANWRITIDGAAKELGIGHERAQKMQSSEVFFEGFLKLIERYDKCQNVLGTCLGK